MVFDDYLALELPGEEGSALRVRLGSELPSTHVLAFSRWMCVRSRYTEDLVQEAVGAGIEQYVILGAGLDSFAYRRHDLIGRVRVFEVDHPSSQSWKRHRLEQLGIGCPADLVFAPVDFEHQALRGCPTPD